MEYAIIEIGGHQVWIEEGQHFITNRILTTPGTSVLINRVLLINKGGNLHFGQPYLENTKIKGQILEHVRGSKITVYKMKSKKKISSKKRSSSRNDKIINKQY